MERHRTPCIFIARAMSSLITWAVPIALLWPPLLGPWILV
jgi:hypothetical protein